MSVPVFRVVLPGLMTTVQDLGRIGFQKDGMTTAGAMDPFALQLANLLVGNPRDAAALEITLLGPTLSTLIDTEIAICGADLAATLDEKPIPRWCSMRVKAGQTLRFAKPVSGTRAYLSMAGGIDVPMVMGSRSTYLRGHIGGMDGRKLRAEDEILASEGVSKPGRAIASSVISDYSREMSVRIILGPHHEALIEASLQTFLRDGFTVTPHSDRMGVRLKGAPLVYRDGCSADLLSEAIPLGAIQIPPDGQPIVLMADRQTTGGYACIGTVISVDLPLIAQLPPGGRMSFQSVSVEEAQDLAIAQEQLLRLLEWRLLEA